MGVRVFQAEVARAATQLVSLCVSLGEYPYVRYNGKSGLCKEIADKVQGELDAMKGAADDVDWNPNRGVLLVADRSMDPVAPLMHEYTYQCFVHDLCDVKGDLIMYAKEERKKK